MLHMGVRSDLAELVRKLEGIDHRFRDLEALADDVKLAMIEDNEQGAIAGLDADGQPYAPLAESTWQWRQKTGRNGGPPLAPDYASSAIVSDYQVEPEVDSGSTIRLVGAWPNTPWVSFHADAERIPRRDAVGIRPRGWDRIEAAVDAHLDRVVG